MGNVMFEIEVIKSRLDAMKSLLDSQGEPSLSAVSKLSNEVKLLQIDLEEEKFKRSVLEVEVKLLRKEINIIKSNRNAVTCPTGNTEVMSEQCTSYSSAPTMNNIEPLVDVSCYEINPLLNQQADNATGNIKVISEQSTSYSNASTMNNTEPPVVVSCYEINPLLNKQADNATGNIEVMSEQSTSYSNTPTMNNLELLVDVSCYEINPSLNQQADNAPNDLSSINDLPLVQNINNVKITDESCKNLETGGKLEDPINKQLHNYRSEQHNLYLQSRLEVGGKNPGYGSFQKASIFCPLLKRRGRCLKGNRCDFKHPKTTLKPPQTMKCNIPCPFLEKRGYCLKKNMCDYYHDELLCMLYTHRPGFVQAVMPTLTLFYHMAEPR